MKKLIYTCVLSTILSASCLMAENQSYNYTSIGAGLNLTSPIPVPNIQIGHREIYEDRAMDISLGFSTAIIASALQMNVNSLSYINAGRSYIGGGLTAQFVIMPLEPFAFFEVMPNFIIGKETEKNFSQVKISAMSFSDYGIAFAPYITYQYGFKF